jgi:hypothetical protein
MTKLDELITQLDIAGMGHNATVLLDCVKELKTRVEALDGTPTTAPEPEGKWRDLRDDEYFQTGDRYRATVKSNWLIVHGLVDECTDMNIGEWKNVEPRGGQAQRRVKAKRPGLKELVKRIPEANWVQLMNDGKCEIVTEDEHSNVYSLQCFLTIAELKDYLATLPESKSK